MYCFKLQNPTVKTRPLEWCFVTLAWVVLSALSLMGLPARAQVGAQAVEPVQVQPGVWMVQGASALGTPANRNFISCPISNLVIGGHKQMADITRGYEGLKLSLIHI